MKTTSKLKIYCLFFLLQSITELGEMKLFYPILFLFTLTSWILNVGRTKSTIELWIYIIVNSKPAQCTFRRIELLCFGFGFGWCYFVEQRWRRRRHRTYQYCFLGKTVIVVINIKVKCAHFKQMLALFLFIVTKSAQDKMISINI